VVGIYGWCGAGVPGAPRILRVENLTKTSATLSWQAPDSDGGGEVIGYFVEKRSNYSTRWVPLNRAPVSLPSYTVRDLTEGEDAEYRVSAANDAGTGPPSETTGVVTARDTVTKPAPPAALTAELDAAAAGRVVQLRWKKPSSDGQSPIVNYVVEMRSNKSPRWKVRPSLNHTTLSTSHTHHTFDSWCSNTFLYLWCRELNNCSIG